MIEPAVYALVVFQGASFDKTFRWTDSNDVPFDLTGCTARMQARLKVTTADALFSLTTENGGLVLGDVDGTVQILIEPAASSAWAWRKAVYDLEVIYPSGRVERFLKGSLTVDPEVTR